MHVLNARNVHSALPEAILAMITHGVERESRNGTVLQADQPVATVYALPQERVLFWPERDANPFFHFYEGLWMLGGRNDVNSLVRFVKRMATFTDDGLVFHGAYGHRWRRHLGMDQLQYIIDRLRKDPNDRRQVLQIWDGKVDLPEQKNKRDLPCNLIVTFQVNFGSLDMTVFNRSNDIIWGCYGANAVHFSMLQEFMATSIGVPMGIYTHVSVNWHAYLATFDPLRDLADKVWQPHRVVQWGNPYEEGTVEPFTMVNTTTDVWLGDLEMFLDEEDKALGYRDPFFRRVALPMVRTHNAFKEHDAPKRYDEARKVAETIRATDWQKAAVEWIDRREQKWRKR